MRPTDSDASVEQLIREHAALRRVATLVAREPSPAEVFEAVAREVGTLLGARRAQLVRGGEPRGGHPLGQPQDFVARVKLAELPREVGQVARDTRVAALPRVDS